MSVDGDRPHTLDELLWHMPGVIRQAGATAWERDFAAAMLAKSRRRNWTPTDKELAAMRRLVAARLEPADLIDTAA